jgi:hypothetical protein
MDPWFTTCIQELCSPEGGDRYKLAQAHIECEVLTFTNLKNALKDECRVLFLRVDIVEKSDTGIQFNLEDEKCSGKEDRIS